MTIAESVYVAEGTNPYDLVEPLSFTRNPFHEMLAFTKHNMLVNSMKLKKLFLEMCDILQT